MYYLIFFILLFFSLQELFFKRRSVLGFNIAYLLMTCMVLFRYGQLTDYFGYKDLYEERNSMPDGRDPLYYYLSEFFRWIGLDYEVVIIIIGLFSMTLCYPFFSKCCSRSLTSLFVFYCYAFLIMPMSAMRQGICFSLLLFGYTLLVGGRKKWFYVIITIGSFIHLSLITAFFIGLFYKKKWYNKEVINWVLLGITLFAIITPDLSSYFVIFGDRAIEMEGDSKVTQLLLRILLILPVLFVKPEYGTHGYYAKAICILGYIIYCVLSFNMLAAARAEYYFRVFLCLFVAFLITSKNRIVMDKVFLQLFILLHVVIFFKNINSFIDQGEYNEAKVSMYNFPYISIFDEEEYDNYK